jgi:hypothetical protein
VAVCKICGTEIPPRIGRGRPRTRCVSCAPSVKPLPPTSAAGTVLAMPARPGASPDRPGIATRVKARLEEIGQLDSIHGDLAMEAAEQIAAGASASAVAVLLDRIARNFEAARKAAGAQEPVGASGDGVDWGVG